MPRVLRPTQKRNFNTQPAGVFLFVPLVDGMLTLLFPLQPFHNVINVYQETRYVAGMYPDLLFYLLFCFLYYAFHAWCNFCNMLMKGFYGHL